jgi:hypothetical protein
MQQARTAVDKVTKVVVASSEAVITAADYASRASEFVDEASESVAPFVGALFDAAPVLAGVWAATNSVLTAIADAPMVGPAVKLLLLFAKGIEAVAGYAALAARAKRAIADLAQALKDIDSMVPRGTQPAPTLTAWVGRLRETLEAAAHNNAAALGAPERPTFVMRLLCAVKGAAFDAARLEASLDDLDAQWQALGPALTIQVGWTLAASSSPAQLLPQLRAFALEAAAGVAGPPLGVPSFPPSLQATTSLPSSQLALRADLLCEATAATSGRAAEKGSAQLALIALLCSAADAGSSPSETAAAASHMRAARLATQCWATSAAREAARDPTTRPPLFVHVDLGSSSSGSSPVLTVLADALQAAADAAGLPPAAAAAGYGACASGSEGSRGLALAVSRLPRPERVGAPLRWALVISGVASPSPELDTLLQVALPLLAQVAVPELTASAGLSAPPGWTEGVEGTDGSSTPAPPLSCCCIVLATAPVGAAADGPEALAPWRAAAARGALPLSPRVSALPAVWLEGAGGEAARARSRLLQSTPLPPPISRLLSALSAAASHAAMTPAPGGAARVCTSIPQLSGLLARCAIAARNAAAVCLSRLAVQETAEEALLPTWVPKAADAAEELLAAIDACGVGSLLATAALRRVVVAASALFAASGGSAPEDEARSLSFGRPAWMGPAVPPDQYLEVSALAAEQNAVQGARHEASLEAIQAVAVAVAATMDVIISPDEVNQRLIAGNLKLATLQSFLPSVGSDSKTGGDDDDGVDFGSSAAAPLTVLTAPAVPLTLWRYSERAAAAAGALARGGAGAAAAAAPPDSSAGADRDGTGPGRLLRNPADAEAEVQGDTTTAAQAIVSSRELCVITGACARAHWRFCCCGCCCRCCCC